MVFNISNGWETDCLSRVSSRLIRNHPVQQANAWSKLLDNAESANAGSRAWPTDKSQDKSIGMRIDWGEIYEKNAGKRLRNLCLQPNADVENVTVKKKANKSTHQNLGVVPTDPANPPTEDEIVEMMRSSVDSN